MANTLHSPIYEYYCGQYTI